MKTYKIVNMETWKSVWYVGMYLFVNHNVHSERNKV